MPYPSHLPVYNTTVSTVLDYKSLLPWPDKTRSDLERGPGRFFAGPWINSRLYLGFTIGRHTKSNLKKKW